MANSPAPGRYRIFRNVEKSVRPEIYAIAENTVKQIPKRPAANPSSPSVRFT